jgi:sensor c-di-GMP phosphodiesterase-like protein
MKRIALVVSVACLALLGACSMTQQADVAQKAQMLQQQAAKACAVVQPTLLSMQSLTAGDAAKQALFAEIVKDNAAVCSGTATVDAASVTSLVNSSIPAAIQGVTLLPIDPATKTAIQIGLIAFQTALSAALAQYGPVAVPVAAASSPSA